MMAAAGEDDHVGRIQIVLRDELLRARQVALRIDILDPQLVFAVKLKFLQQVAHVLEDFLNVFLAAGLAAGTRPRPQAPSSFATICLVFSDSL